MNVSEANESGRRFQLRKPSAVVLAFAVALVVPGLWLAAIFAWNMNAQLTLIDEIRSHAGNVRTEPRFPEWLRSVLGDRWREGTDVIVGVQVQNDFSDSDLRRLAGLRSLQVLALHSVPVTDEGLREIAAMKKLQVLLLIETKITDDGLKSLSELNELAFLNISSTDVSDAGLEHLQRLPLKTLWAYHTRVSAKGAAEFERHVPSCDVLHDKSESETRSD